MPPTTPDTTPATTTAQPPATPALDPSIGRLVSDATKDISTLVQHEIALAKAELRISAKAGGLGIGLFAGAAFIVLLAVMIGSFMLVYLIHLTGLNLAWCYAIVFLLYVLLAGVLGYFGVRSVKKVRAPERSIAQAQATKDALLNRG